MWPAGRRLPTPALSHLSFTLVDISKNSDTKQGRITNSENPGIKFSGALILFAHLIVKLAAHIFCIEDDLTTFFAPHRGSQGYNSLLILPWFQ